MYLSMHLFEDFLFLTLIFNHYIYLILFIGL